MSIGTVMGSTRRAPFSRRVSHASSVVQMPPMPEDTTTPRRSGSSSGEPASAHASRAAITAYWAEGSMRLISGRAMTSSGLTLMVAAKVTGISYFSAQSFSNVRAPDSPASAAAHVLGTSPPSGVVAPRPVTTTSICLLMCSPEVGRAPGAVRWAPHPASTGARAGGSSGLGAGDEAHGVADGREVLDLVVGDAHGELLLGERDDRHHRQRVDVEVVGEGLVELDGDGLEARLLADDLGQSLEDLALGVRHGDSLDGLCSGRCGWLSPGCPDILAAGRPASGQDDHLCRVDQSTTEADLEHEVARGDLLLADQA